MAKEIITKTLTPSGYFAPTDSFSAIYTAAAKQGEADWEQYKLNKKHSNGKINDKEYITGLQDLAHNYLKGTTTRQGIEETLIGAAQEKADLVREQQELNQSSFVDQAKLRWEDATTAYATGQISLDEYNAERDLYQESLLNLRKIPTKRKLTKNILTGKFWDQYKSGSMRDLVRNQQIKSLYKETIGKPSRMDLKPYKKMPTKLSVIESAMKLSDAYKKKTGAYYAYGETRDLSKEQQAVSQLRSALGRLPTPSEINALTYGAYPIEYIQAGQFDKNQKFNEL